MFSRLLKPGEAPLFITRYTGQWGVRFGLVICCRMAYIGKQETRVLKNKRCLNHVKIFGCHPALIKSTLKDLLVAKWIRIYLPMQGTRIRSLVWEDSTCCKATKAGAAQLLSPCAAPEEVCVPNLCSITTEVTARWRPCAEKKSSPRSLQLEKAWAQQLTLSATKNKWAIFKKPN